MTDSIRYVGVDDRDVDLFEGQYVVPNGMAYNSYVTLDEKVAILDTRGPPQVYGVPGKPGSRPGGPGSRTTSSSTTSSRTTASSVQAVVERWPEVKLVRAQDLPAPCPVLPGAGLLLRPHGEGGGGALPGRPYTPLHLRPHGPLAGGHDEL